MEKDQSQLAGPAVILATKLESLPEFNENEKLILKLLITQKVRIGLIARLSTGRLESALREMTENNAKILSVDLFSMTQEENNSILAIANRIGISDQRFKELTLFVIENEETW